MTTATACRHHWVVEATDARIGNETLDAVCKLCAATRTFPKVQMGRDWSGRLKEDP
jgi:cytochrome c5